MGNSWLIHGQFYSSACSLWPIPFRVRPYFRMCLANKNSKKLPLLKKLESIKVYASISLQVNGFTSKFLSLFDAERQFWEMRIPCYLNLFQKVRAIVKRKNFKNSPLCKGCSVFLGRFIFIGSPHYTVIRNPCNEHHLHSHLHMDK